MPKFPGCTPLDGNFTSVPNVVLEHLDLITSMGEMKVIMYVMRHTFGFRKGRTDFQQERKLTLDEFMNGRKYRNQTRMDAGTGLSKPTVLDGLKRAIEHGFISVEIDDSDGGRVKKFYSPVMKDETVSDDEKTEKIFTSHSTNPYPQGEETLHPTEKETEKETKRKKISAPKKAEQTPTPPPIQNTMMVSDKRFVTTESQGLTANITISQEYPNNNPIISQEPTQPETIDIPFGPEILEFQEEKPVSEPENELTTRTEPDSEVGPGPAAHVYTAKTPPRSSASELVYMSEPAVLPRTGAWYEGEDIVIPPNGMKLATLNAPPSPVRPNGRAAPAAVPKPAPDATPTKARQKEIGQELLAHFVATTGIIAPELDTNKQWKAAQKRWFQPLREIARICGWDVDRARDRIDRAWGKFVGDGNRDWISTPQSLLATCRALSKTKTGLPISFAGGLVPLTEAHKNVRLFGEKSNEW